MSEGRFQIQNQVSSAGALPTWDGVDSLTGDRVALQLVHVPDDLKEQERLDQVLSYVSRNEHPGFLPFLGSERTWLGYTVAFPPLLGLALPQVVSGRAVPLRALLRFAEQTLSAVDYMHRLGVVHGAISPGTIGFEWDDAGDFHVRLLECGLGAYAPPGYKPSFFQDSPVGPYSFECPEKLKNKRRDTRWDLYSLGCAFYYLLTARAPFPGATREEIAEAQNAAPVTPLNEIRPELPGFVSDWVMWHINIQAGNRPQTAVKSVETLRSFLPALLSDTLAIPTMQTARSNEAEVEEGGAKESSIMSKVGRKLFSAAKDARAAKATKKATKAKNREQAEAAWAAREAPPAQTAAVGHVGNFSSAKETKGLRATIGHKLAAGLSGLRSSPTGATPPPASVTQAQPVHGAPIPAPIPTPAAQPPIQETSEASVIITRPIERMPRPTRDSSAVSPPRNEPPAVTPNVVPLKARSKQAPASEPSGKSSVDSAGNTAPVAGISADEASITRTVAKVHGVASKKKFSTARIQIQPTKIVDVRPTRQQGGAGTPEGGAGEKATKPTTETPPTKRATTQDGGATPAAGGTTNGSNGSNGSSRPDAQAALNMQKETSDPIALKADP